MLRGGEWEWEGGWGWGVRLEFFVELLLVFLEDGGRDGGLVEARVDDAGTTGLGDAEEAGEAEGGHAVRAGRGGEWGERVR